MKNADATVNFLFAMKHLGLKEYEAKLYLALAKPTHAASAGELSRLAGVPYTKVYVTMQSLTERGLVEVMRGKPATYRAVDPSAALIDLKEDMISRISRSTETALDSLQKIQSGELGAERMGDTETGSWNIIGRRNVTNKFLEELAKAKRSVSIVFPNLNLLPEFATSNAGAGSKRLNVRLLVSSRDKEFVLKSRITKDFEVRYNNYIRSRYALFDDRSSLMIAIETPDYWTGVFERCRNCSRQAVEHFKLAWEASTAS